MASYLPRDAERDVEGFSSEPIYRNDAWVPWTKLPAPDRRKLRTLSREEGEEAWVEYLCHNSVAEAMNNLEEQRWAISKKRIPHGTRAHSYYKTRLCVYESEQLCPNRDRCKFAHGIGELRRPIAPPLSIDDIRAREEKNWRKKQARLSDIARLSSLAMANTDQAESGYSSVAASSFVPLPSSPLRLTTAGGGGRVEGMSRNDFSGGSIGSSSRAPGAPMIGMMQQQQQQQQPTPHAAQTNRIGGQLFLAALNDRSALFGPPPGHNMSQRGMNEAFNRMGLRSAEQQQAPDGGATAADAAAALSPSGMWGIPPLVGHDRTWDGSPIAYGQQNKDEDWKVIGRKRDG
jgi:hypothetical protein